ncbi:MAG: NmrA family NAD(P)-binding protein [Anaerolineae bacterium]|nr:NmrA family NAD(P)-binding protein [Anaerolineae bacterium]
MILVTGASGKTGRAVISALTRRQASVRALVRRDDQVQGLRALGAAEVVVGDLRNAQVLSQAAKGVKAIYHICPNVSPFEVEIGSAVILAARQEHVSHFVFHSVLHPQIEEMPHHWLKMRVEERLFESGLPFTILQPAAYMQNILANRDAMHNEGIFAVPYAPETRLSMVDLEDVAEVAARVLLAPEEHLMATYELCGCQAVSQIEVAEIFGQAFGRQVTARAIPREEWALRMQELGMDAYALNTLLRMFVYYETYGFHGNPKVLSWLLQRAPTSLEDFAARVAAG